MRDISLMREVGEKFYVKKDGLVQCAGTIQKYGEKDVNQWILERIKPQLTDRVLDIGCGHGNQMVALKPKVAKVIGIDKSPELVTFCNKRDLIVKVGDMEKVDKLFDEKFDVIMCCWAIYYCDIERVFQAVSKLLDKDGVFFVAGPRIGNSPELDYYYGELPSWFQIAYTSAADVCLAANMYFKWYKVSLFENRIVYPSVVEFERYLFNVPNYTLTDKQKEEMHSKAEKEFMDKGCIVITKKAVGVLCGNGQKR